MASHLESVPAICSAADTHDTPTAHDTATA